MNKIGCLVFIALVIVFFGFGIEAVRQFDQDRKNFRMEHEAVQQDKEGVLQEAVKRTRKSAEQGNSKVQRILGTMYASGQGVSQDYKAAVKRTRKSAEQGNATAQYNLGVTYERGQGVSQDYKAAVKHNTIWGSCMSKDKVFFKTTKKQSSGGGSQQNKGLFKHKTI